MDHLQHEHPFVSVEGVVFTLKNQPAESYRKLPEPRLHLLLYQRSEEPYLGRWCLPGGFLHVDELPEHSVRRKIQQRVQEGGCYLEQLGTFCDPQRDPRARVLSLAYLGLVCEAQAGNVGLGKQWFAVEDAPGGGLVLQGDGLTLYQKDLAFDHGQMAAQGLARLRGKLNYSPLLFHLMPPEFTLTQLQNAYQTILGRTEQTANFRRKMAPWVCSTGQILSKQGHRPAVLFTKRSEHESMGGNQP